nr:MAG: terminase large subunit [Caudoviricetes sp.]
MYNIGDFKGRHTVEYVSAINDGSIVVSQAIHKQLKRLMQLATKYEFKQQETDRRIKFIENETSQTKGSQSRLKLAPVQKFWLENMYSWYKVNERGQKVRLINEVLIMQGRGGGKTTFAGAVSVVELMLSNTYGPEIQFIANTMEQAEEGFGAVRDMFSREDTMLNDYWRRDIIRSSKTGIRFEAINGRIKKRALDYDSLDGGNTSANVFDEIHAYTESPIKVVNDGSSRKRAEWLSVYITTNGVVRDMAFDNHLKTWRSILDGNIEDDSILLFMYEIDEPSDIYDENKWQKANPMLGYTVKYETIRKDIETSKDDPVAQAEIMAKTFNYPVNNYLAYFTNEEAEGNKEQFTDAVFADNIGVLGVDLSQINDLSSWSVMIKQDGKYIVKERSFMPRQTFNGLSQREQKHYMDFEVEGNLVIHDYPTNNPDFMFSNVIEWLEELDVTPVMAGLDFWAVSNGLLDKFRGYGIEPVRVNMNAHTLSIPTKTYKSLLASGDLIFNDDLLSWNVRNVNVKLDANMNVFPNKEKANNKIDAFMSSLFALTVFLSQDDKMAYYYN